MASFAQKTSKGKTGKKRTNTTKNVKNKKTQVPVTKPQPTQVAGIDTSKKLPVAPPKHFDRPLDGYFKKTNIANAKVTPYPNLREVDVAYAKRIWREIDLREKMNQYLGSPKQRLIEILMAAIESGELTAFDATPDQPG